MLPIVPDRRMFRIHDSEAHPDSPDAPLPPVGVLASASREQLLIGSLQQDIDIRLVLETAGETGTPLPGTALVNQRFVEMNAALLVGFVKFSRGTQGQTWTRTDRTAKVAA